MMTDSWVMAAMTRSAPRRQKGHVAISRANTRSRSLAQLPGRPSRGLRPRALLMALPYPILSGLSRLHSTALRLALGRVDGAAAPPWAREYPRRGVAAGGGRWRLRWGALARGRRTNAVCFSYPLRLRHGMCAPSNTAAVLCSLRGGWAVCPSTCRGLRARPCRSSPNRCSHR